LRWLGPPRFFEIQPRSAVTPKRLQQPPHLALAAPQELRRSTHRQPTPIDVPQLRIPAKSLGHSEIMSPAVPT
jgi:hypothetical protein